MRFHRSLRFFLSVFTFGASLFAFSGLADTGRDRFVILASTTSAENSGLYDYLFPFFTEQTGLKVKVVAVGTGQALALATRGDADLVIAHDRESELAFVASGCGIDRRTFIYNDYVIVGPSGDPAAVAKAPSLYAAMRSIVQSQGRSVFISRGDDSGTNKRELSLWKKAGIEVHNLQRSRYLEVGGGMGRTLNMANGMNAYTLTDRATWLSFQNRSQLRVLVENKPPLLNPYSVIRVNPDCHPHVRHRQALLFVDWLTSDSTLDRIEQFKVAGQALFFRCRQSAGRAGMHDQYSCMDLD